MSEVATSADSVLQMFYVSRCRAPAQALDELIDVARRNNEQRGITGALLYTGGHFAQVLEGPEDAVRRTMASIERDPRHTAVRRLLEAPMPRRLFGLWSMALRDAPGADEVVKDLLVAPEVPMERAERLRALLFSTGE